MKTKTSVKDRLVERKKNPRISRTWDLKNVIPSPEGREQAQCNSCADKQLDCTREECPPAESGFQATERGIGSLDKFSLIGKPCISFVKKENRKPLKTAENCVPNEVS